MIWTLRLLFSTILISMLSVTSWASFHENILLIPQATQSDPWFIATLFDAYAGFLTFYAWLCYKSTGVFSKLVWLALILLLGNIAMSAYMLILLFKLPANASLQDVWMKKERALCS